jgi:hypothetical protein
MKKKFKTKKKSKGKNKDGGMTLRQTPQRQQNQPRPQRRRSPARRRTPPPRRRRSPASPQQRISPVQQEEEQERQVNVYCGNNRLNREVQNGNAVIGTRHRCLKKGFGVGFYALPVDMDMLLDYEPIVREKIYCGNNNNLPDNYDRFGNLPSCFQKGVGIGKKKRAEREV